MRMTTLYYNGCSVLQICMAHNAFALTAIRMSTTADAMAE